MTNLVQSSSALIASALELSADESNRLPGYDLGFSCISNASVFAHVLRAEQPGHFIGFYGKCTPGSEFCYEAALFTAADLHNLDAALGRYNAGDFNRGFALINFISEAYQSLRYAEALRTDDLAYQLLYETRHGFSCDYY